MTTTKIQLTNKERFINIKVKLPGDPRKPIPFDQVSYILKQYTKFNQHVGFIPSDTGDEMLIHVTNSWEKQW